MKKKIGLLLLCGCAFASLAISAQASAGQDQVVVNLPTGNGQVVTYDLDLVNIDGIKIWLPVGPIVVGPTVPPAAHAPEINSASATAALTLLLGFLAVVTDRRRFLTAKTAQP
jgi:hypothetical protein